LKISFLPLREAETPNATGKTNYSCQTSITVHVDLSKKKKRCGKILKVFLTNSIEARVEGNLANFERGKSMKFSHKCILIAGAILWFFLFWNLSEHDTFKYHSTILIKIVSVLAPVILIFYAFTATEKDIEPATYDYDESKFNVYEKEEKKEKEKEENSS
jgi:hypothetical protein